LPKPCDSPTSCLRLTDQPLEPILISKLWTPRSTDVTFPEQPTPPKKKQRALLWSLDFSFKTSHIWPRHKKIFLQILTLVVPLWHCDCPGTPSEFPSLTQQALLQVMHSFVKEDACFWKYKVKRQGPRVLSLHQYSGSAQPASSFPSILATDGRRKS
jgi:hypothetical protein